MPSEKTPTSTPSVPAAEVQYLDVTSSTSGVKSCKCVYRVGAGLKSLEILRSVIPLQPIAHGYGSLARLTSAPRPKSGVGATTSRRGVRVQFEIRDESFGG